MTDVSLASLALRLAVSMGVVIGLMFVAAKVLRRAQAFAYGNGTGRTDGATKAAKGSRSRRGASNGRRRGRITTIPIAVTTIAPLTRSASVAIVRASGRELVLGVTDTHVTLLHSSIDTDDDRAPEQPDIDLDDELEALTRGAASFEAVDADGHEHSALDAITSSPTSAAARIAAADPGSPDRVTGLPAWTDALETLRAMTVRR